MSGSSQPIRRFFLEDSFSQSNKLTVLSAFILQFTFQGGKILSPRFEPTYTLLSTELGTGVIGQSSHTLSFEVLFTTDLGTFWTGAIASFIVVSVAAIVHTIIKTYIGFLNRKSFL